MTGFDSKRQAAQDKLEDDDIQVYQRSWVGLTDKHVFEVLENLQKMLIL